MCGIAGFNLHPSEKEVDALDLARKLLVAITSRGRDAAGAGWTEDGEVWYEKSPTPGSSFAQRLSLTPLARNAILHTRYATQGTPAVNANNHPFALPGITGVHNGIILNDWEIFDLLGVERTAETDSEAIFALLARSGLAPTDCFELLRGDASVAWIETDKPNRLHLARVCGRPLAVGETKAGSCIFASTEPLLRIACRQAGVKLDTVWNVPEWTYFVVEDGALVTVERFGPAKATVTTKPKKAPAKSAIVSSGKRSTKTPVKRTNSQGQTISVYRPKKDSVKTTPLWERDASPRRWGHDPSDLYCVCDDCLSDLGQPWTPGYDARSL